MPKWYIMDEFGSRIQHSDDPNFCVAPFFYAATGMGFSLMWPVKEVHPEGKCGVKITRRVSLCRGIVVYSDSKVDDISSLGKR